MLVFQGGSAFMADKPKKDESLSTKAFDSFAGAATGLGAIFAIADAIIEGKPEKAAGAVADVDLDIDTDADDN